MATEPVRIVVTGALGHIGSRLIRVLPSTFPKAEVVMVDNLSTQRFASLFNLPAEGRYRFVEDDVVTAALESLVSGASVVIHLAAMTDAAGSVAIKEKVEHHNFTATERVAQACARARAPLVYISSTSVYGTQHDVVDEDCPPSDLRPQSPYAKTKLHEEELLGQLGREAGLAYVICRFGTIFGVSPGMRFHTAVNKFCWQAVLGQPITVWRTAFDQRRPYLDLGDAVEAIAFIMMRQLFDRRIYNVVTTNATVRAIVDLIKTHVPDLTVQFVEAAIMNQLSYTVSNARFTGEGFVFRGDLTEGIAQTIQWLRSANDGARRKRYDYGEALASTSVPSRGRR